MYATRRISYEETQNQGRPRIILTWGVGSLRLAGESWQQHLVQRKQQQHQQRLCFPTLDMSRRRHRDGRVLRLGGVDHGHLPLLMLHPLFPPLIFLILLLLFPSSSCLYSPLAIFLLFCCCSSSSSPPLGWFLIRKLPANSCIWCAFHSPDGHCLRCSCTLSDLIYVICTGRRNCIKGCTPLSLSAAGRR